MAGCLASGIALGLFFFQATHGKGLSLVDTGMVIEEETPDFDGVEGAKGNAKGAHMKGLSCY